MGYSIGQRVSYTIGIVLLWLVDIVATWLTIKVLGIKIPIILVAVILIVAGIVRIVMTMGMNAIKDWLEESLGIEKE